MSRKAGKKKHTLLIVLAILLAVLATGVLILMTHTQIIVGTIQKLSASTVNTQNSYEPLGKPMEGVKDNGQYIITEVKYSENYPNSFLDITYPDENRETPRPTLIYFHGGGFFGGSKSVGDPLAESDATALLDDICAEGFNLVNIDYVLVPEYHFPAPLIQANEAFQFLIDHAAEYHLNMDRVVIMGSSAGAIMTSQLGSIITNPDYAKTLGISPVLKPEQVKAVVLDDAPLVYDKFSLRTKVLVGNYVKGSIFLGREEKQKYNNILWVDSNYPDAFLLGSEYYVDMRELDAALTSANAKHALVDPFCILLPVSLSITKKYVNVSADESVREKTLSEITRLFALLALAGDLGGAVGPAIIGNVSQKAANNLQAGVLAGIGFPILEMPQTQHLGH